MARNFILWVLVTALLGSLSVSGQQSRGFIGGLVRDSEGHPLSGASVLIDSLSAGVATGNNGRYMLRGLKNGVYKVRFSFTGYETVTETVTLTGIASVDVILGEATVIADEVIVRGSRAGSRTPMAHTTIEGSELRKSDMTRDMPYLLALTPSVVETSDAGNGVGYTSLRIRGTDANRINITVDGIPLNDSESQQVFWVDLPDLASSTGSIQIQRGAGTSTNGAGAFGASVNISTLTPPDDPGAVVDLAAGSFNTFRTTAKVWSGKVDDRFNMMIRASKISSNGYIDHSASDIKSVMVSGDWITPVDRIRFNILSGNERTGISWWGVPRELLSVNRKYNPSGEYTDANGITQYYDDETDNYKQTHYHLFYTHRFAPHLHLNTGLHLTDGSGYYEEQKSDRDTEEYGFGTIISGNEIITEMDLVQRKWMSNNFYGAVWSLVQEGHTVDWTAGGGANRYDGDHFGKILWMEYPGNIIPGHEWYRNRGVKDEFNVYGKMNARISNSISGFIDLQFRYIGYRLSGPDDDLRDLSQDHYYRFFNPKTGLFWSNGRGNDAFLSVSVAHREPTRSNFTDAAGDNSVTPRPEQLTDYEGGYSFRTSALSLNLNLYLMRYHDQLIPTGKISNTGYPVMTNVPESYRTGAEISGSYRPSPLAAFKINMTWSRNKIKNFRNYYFDYNTTDWSEEYVWSDLGSVDIAYSPRFSGSAEVEVNILERMALRLNGKYVGKQYFDNTMSSDRSIRSYFVSNMAAEYDIKTGNPEEISFKILVNNLFNTLYESNAYGGMWSEDGNEKTWAYFFPQAGINFMLGATVTF
ncbi:MAG TPA: carboxypeptidase-like regulatory domain-containing protein [Bacteroidales bacterium]|nr:carboxypeptidase-like regulatory domain-containing protein [Bacteroidales bacterium]